MWLKQHDFTRETFLCVSPRFLLLRYSWAQLRSDMKSSLVTPIVYYMLPLLTQMAALFLTLVSAESIFVSVYTHRVRVRLWRPTFQRNYVRILNIVTWTFSGYFDLCPSFFQPCTSTQTPLRLYFRFVIMLELFRQPLIRIEYMRFCGWTLQVGNICWCCPFNFLYAVLWKKQYESIFNTFESSSKL
jgi:hypothetical protein